MTTSVDKNSHQRALMSTPETESSLCNLSEIVLEV